MGEATRGEPEKESGKKDGKKGREEVRGECRGRSGHPASLPTRQKASGEPARKARAPSRYERKLHPKEPTKEKREREKKGGEGGCAGGGGRDEVGLGRWKWRQRIQQAACPRQSISDQPKDVRKDPVAWRCRFCKKRLLKKAPKRILGELHISQRRIVHFCTYLDRLERWMT